jgi:hypothetical protein
MNVPAPPTIEGSARGRVLPRGIRNNNPGNIRHSKDKWHGASAEQPDKSFVKFDSMVWGVRALARTLITYIEKHGLETPAGIVSRWAPPNENDTIAYVQAVAAAMGMHPDDSIDSTSYRQMSRLVLAIIRHENGDPKRYGITAWVKPEDLREGLRRAGIVQSAPTTVREAAKRDPEGVAVVGTATGTAAGAGGTVYLLNELREANASLRHHGEETGEAAFVVAPVVLTLIAAAALVFFWLKRKRTERK